MRRVRKLSLTGLAMLGVLAWVSFSAAPALAGTGHGFSSFFGTGGKGQGQFQEPAGVAVNDTAGSLNKGDVYVVDKGNNRVERFSSTGTYLGQFNGVEYEAEGVTHTSATSDPTGKFLEPEWIAVDNSGSASDPSKEDVYVTDNGHDVVDKFSANGAYLGQITTGEGGGRFGELPGVGVDSNGLVWVSAGGIDSYSDALVNTLVSSLGEPEFGDGDSGFAVDSEDNLYAAHNGNHRVEKLSDTGEELSAQFCGETGISGITVDLSNNDVYLDNGSAVIACDSTGSELERFGNEHLSAGVGVGVDSASDTIYVADSAANDVDVFTVGPRAQTPKTEAPEKITASSATLRGELRGEETGYYFAYNTNGSCTGAGTTATALEAATGTVKESANVTGLQPSEKYTYCVEAENNFGPEPGSPETFETLPLPPEVIADSEHASATSPSEARFEAQINPNNQATKCEFQYGAEASLTTGTTTLPCETETLEGFNEQGDTDGVTVSGLETGTTYYYRVIAENAKGEKREGAIARFSKEPLIEGESVSQVTSTGAKLEATINPDYQETSYTFEYATSEKLLEENKGEKLPGASTLPAEFTGMPVSTTVSGLLEPGRTYYYRVVAENETTTNDGKPAEGGIESFTAVPAPAVTTGEVQSVTHSTAVLYGTVDPEGAEVSYYFEYVSEARYRAALAKGAANPYAEGETTAPLEVTEAGGGVYTGTEPQAVGPAIVAGLTPGETYHYALVAANRFSEEATGQDATFTTLAGTPPTVSTGGVSNVSQNSATLSGTVSTNSLQTEYGFEIGTEPGNYGPATGLGAIGGAATEEVHVTLGELQPGTTYYYRITATNADGTETGQPASFTTPGFPTLVMTPAAPPLIAYTSPGFPTGSLANTQSPTIAVVKHSVHGNTATLEVSVPSAGKLVATGKGVSKGTGRASNAGNVTVKVTLTKSEAAFLKKHRGRKLKVSVNVTFTPKAGGRLETTTTVLIG